MKCTEVIASPDADLKPFAPTPPPARQPNFRLLAPLICLTIVARTDGSRLDLFQEAHEPKFMVEFGAAVAAAIAGRPLLSRPKLRTARLRSELLGRRNTNL